MKRIFLIFAVLVAGVNQLHAGINFFDDFESEPVPPISPGFIGDYRGFANWDVVGSGVDLVGPGPAFPPRINDNMVDLDGTSGSTLITKQTFDLFPGIDYVLRFDLSGPVGGTALDTVTVELGSVFNESITVERGADTATFTRTITTMNPTVGKLSFTDLGADSNGAFLDNVQFNPIPDPSTLFVDDFESEPEPTDPRGFTTDYRDFLHWDVLGVGVDLIARRFFPQQGIVVDLDGEFAGSTLITKQEIELPVGMYTLTFDLGGPFGGILQDTVVVSLGDIFTESITINRGAPFETIVREIIVTEQAAGKLSFTDLGADSNGALLDNVRLIDAGDILPPVITGVTDFDFLWPPNHKMVDVSVQLEATDDQTPTSELFDTLQVTVASNEPDSGGKVGDVNGSDAFTAPLDVSDLFTFDTESGLFVGSLDLRAERYGKGDGRTYTIDAAVSDAAGNVGATTLHVNVPHNRSVKAIPEPTTATLMAVAILCFVGFRGRFRTP